MRAVVCVAIALIVGCGKSAVPPEAAEPGVVIDDVMSVYRANPAKAFLEFRDKEVYYKGLTAIRIQPSSGNIRGIYLLACSVPHGINRNGLDYIIYCTETEAARIEVGKPFNATLIMQHREGDQTPAFRTPAYEAMIQAEANRP